MSAALVPILESLSRQHTDAMYSAMRWRWYPPSNEETKDKHLENQNKIEWKSLTEGQKIMYLETNKIWTEVQKRTVNNIKVRWKNISENQNK